MRNKIGLLAIVVALGGILLPGCLKDKVKKTYTMYIPVYTKKTIVMSSINGDPGHALAKAGQIYIKDSYIYLNELNSGIHVIDNSDPAHPVQVAFLNIPGNQNIGIRGNILFADMYSDLLAIDISNIRQVKIIDTLLNAIPYRNFGQNENVITGWIKKDTTVDVETRTGTPIMYDVPGTPYYSVTNNAAAAAASSLGSGSIGLAGSTATMALVGDYLYVIPEPHSLNTINVSDPSKLAMSSAISAGYDIETIFPIRNRLLLGSKTGVYLFSLDHPDHPTSLGQFSHGRACDPVIADPNYAYVTLRSGTSCGGASNELDVLSAQDLTQVSMLKSYPMTNPSGLAKDGSVLFVCDGPDVKVFDASDPSNLKQLGSLQISGAYDVIASNHVLLVASPTGLDQFDYSDPSHIVSLSHLAISQNQQ
ncbi:MAG: hypothetical protein JST42_28360 [Bacteroidetes bacterium]|nr:hypothetical protein [Bacteroidota bacterium]